MFNLCLTDVSYELDVVQVPNALASALVQELMGWTTSALKTALSELKLQTMHNPHPTTMSGRSSVGAELI